MSMTINPELDLVIEREIDAPPGLVWKALTQAEHVKQWFVPKPWIITSCEIDLRPGGLFRTLMQSPDGSERSDRDCCFLEIVPEQRLVWTDALLPGFRPSNRAFITGMVTLAPEGSGTRYTATALHADRKTRDRHEEAGFFDGWGTVADQLGEYTKAM